MKDFYDNDLEVMIEAIQRNITDSWSDEVPTWEKCSGHELACPKLFHHIFLSLFKALWPKKPVEESFISEEAVSTTSIEATFEDLKVDAQEKASEVPKAANGVAYDVGKKFQKGGGKKKSSQTVEIFKGDTLWGLSRKYGIWDSLIIETAMKDFYDNDLEVMIEAIQRNITDSWSDEVPTWEKCSGHELACPKLDQICHLGIHQRRRRSTLCINVKEHMRK